MRDLTLDDMISNQHVVRRLEGPVSGIYVEFKGEFVGMCGLMPIRVNMEGEPRRIQHWCFLDIISDEFREKFSVYIALNMLRSVKALKISGLKYVYTFLDLRIPRSRELLEKLGFEPIPVHMKTPHIYYTAERWGECWWKRL